MQKIQRVYDIVNEFNKRVAMAQKERKEKEAEFKKRVAAYEERLSALGQKQKKILEQIVKNEGEYLTLLEKEGEYKKSLEAENEKLKEKHKAGEISLQEFTSKLKGAEAVSRLAREKVADDVHAARLACRTVAVEKIRLELEITDLNVKLNVIIQEFLRKFIETVDRQREEFSKYTGYPGNPHMIAQRQQALFDQLETAEREYGKAQIFVIQSLTELELLAVNGIIHEKHFGRLDEVIRELRGLNFDEKKIVITYHASNFLAFHEGITYDVVDKFGYSKN